jgi:hypothetical protein
MTNFRGYIEISEEPKKAFALVQSALEGSIYKPVDSNLKSLELNFKTSTRFMKNSWGEKIRIVINSKKSNSSVIYIESKNNTGSPGIHKSNVEEIITLIKSQVSGEKNIKVTDNGFITGAAVGTVAASTTTWFVTEEFETEDNQDGAESGFDFDY